MCTRVERVGIEHQSRGDEAYDLAFYRPAAALAVALRDFVERPLIGGAIAGVGGGTRDVGRLTSRVQTGRLRTFAMTAITAVLVLVIATAGGAQALPRDAAGFAGLALLAVFYCIAMMALFYVLPRVSATSTGALNFEPIALLVLTWLFLGHTLSALQILGALVTVSAIAWLGMKK